MHRRNIYDEAGVKPGAHGVVKKPRPVWLPRRVKLGQTGDKTSTGYETSPFDVVRVAGLNPRGQNDLWTELP